MLKLVCVLGVVAGLAGCSSPAPAAAPTSTVPVIVPGTPGGPNKTMTALPTTGATVDPDDVAFLSDMMVHHTQALVMAERARTVAVNPKVKALAERIRVGQEPEIEAMRQLLTARGQTPPPLEHVEHTDHSSMPGMATPAQLAALQQATGKSFDTMFLNLMIKHHEGAVTMGGKQLENGADDRITELAQEVAVTQTKEIATMRAVLKEL
ncbi:uncharacterized protein (DUF305 family) [Kribbella sp. VKM Ac-2527]|uniref:Uncharacterized protein (DUF305 family) n=1 Tax=Kribbella caucasensis TaxID=2512215 RepID=A0A4R6KLQ3_9ACTN|nr:DUF305 domain-containing protein [Kribbella sp. VKM Ac-2527]TDO50726.1 uncharacterized protein (DUF305 family) [Kribbella sp. VKM Ac-2527]